MSQPAARADDMGPDKNWAVTGLTLFFLCLFSIPGWLLLNIYFPSHFNYPRAPDLDFYTTLLPPAIAALLLGIRMIAARRFAAGITTLAAYPLFILAHIIALGLAEWLLYSASPRSFSPSRTLVAALPVTCAWLWIATRRYEALAPGYTVARLQKQVRKSISYLDTLLFILLIGSGLLYLAMPTTHTYGPRERVSELILAGSSAKTALSEGMQTYGSWSASWMSAITISATGLVLSASVSPTGVITVWGTAPTSGSVITMIPRTTTDNKLIWSCTGRPAKYMPASCR